MFGVFLYLFEQLVILYTCNSTFSHSTVERHVSGPLKRRMSLPIVLIIGCGVAGPVLACLLKRKGYRPIVFEKVRQLGDAGASLMLMPNG